jgi:serine/threonine-protein kinase
VVETIQLAAGAILDRTYELIEPIGRGGMGTVWKAKHLRLPKHVAIKILKQSVLTDLESRTRFRREAEIVSQIGHPHIVEALDFNLLEDDTPYLVLELLEGESLRHRLGRGPLSPRDAAIIATQVSGALRAAHAKGIVHRDLKPENIFLCRMPDSNQLHAKVLDFGISKIATHTTTLTSEGSIVGTPDYMAPEQVEGGATDGKTDQFALAAIVYEMLAGERPFVADQPLQVLYQIVHRDPRPLTETPRSVSRALSDVVCKGLAKVKAERHTDMMTFASELRRAAGLPESSDDRGSPVSATAPNRGALTGQTSDSGPIADATAQTLRADVTSLLAESRPMVTPAIDEARGGVAQIWWRWAVVLLVIGLTAGAGFAIWRASHGTSADDPSSGTRSSQDTSRDRAPRAATHQDAATAQLRASLRADTGVKEPHDSAGVRPDAAAERAPADANADQSSHRIDASGTSSTRRPERQRKIRPPTQESLSPLPATYQHELDAAQRAMAAGQYHRATALGRRLVLVLPSSHKGLGYAVLVRALCANRDQQNAKAYVTRVPKRQRRETVQFCRRFLDDF